MSMLRANRKVKRHNDFIEVLLTHPLEAHAVLESMGVFQTGGPLTSREERKALRMIKERVNGSDHSRQEP